MEPSSAALVFSLAGFAVLVTLLALCVSKKKKRTSAQKNGGDGDADRSRAHSIAASEATNEPLDVTETLEMVLPPRTIQIVPV